MTKLLRPAIYFIFITLFLTGCFSVKPVNVGDVKDYQFKNLTKSGVSIILDIPIENQNNFKFKITNVNIDISIDGNKLGTVTKIKKIVVPAKSNDTYTFELRADFSKLLKGSWSILKSFMKRSVDMHLQGYIKVKAFFISKKIDIDENKHIKLSNYKLF